MQDYANNVTNLDIEIVDTRLEALNESDGIYIPAGEYWDNRFELLFSSFRGRKIAADLAINVGEFYTGLTCTNK